MQPFCLVAAQQLKPFCLCLLRNLQAELEAAQRQLRDAQAGGSRNTTQAAPTCTCPLPPTSPPPAAEPAAASRQGSAAVAAASANNPDGSQALPAWGLPALRAVSVCVAVVLLLRVGSLHADLTPLYHWVPCTPLP